MSIKTSANITHDNATHHLPVLIDCDKVDFNAANAHRLQTSESVYPLTVRQQ